MAAIVVAASASVAMGQEFDVALTSGSGTIETTTTLTTAGSLIGDYDAQTNPEGTQTRPGFFGGSGNNPIPVSADFVSQTGGVIGPTGSLVLTLDLDAATADIEGLTLDLLGGQALAAEIALTLLYDSFHTVNPSFIYPGGVPITLPLGQIGSVVAATLEQTDTGFGVLTPTGEADVYEFAAAVPASASFEVNIAPAGSDPAVQQIGPLAVVVALGGQITLIDDDHLLLSIAVGPLTDEQTVPIDPAAELPAVPLELPTLGTETAGVVMTLSADSVHMQTLVELSVTGQGTRVGCIADWDSDGVLSFFDVMGFLSDFAAQDPRADLAGPDGVFDFFDVQVFLQLFSAGCPEL